jgi:hypothetical protein
VEYKGRDESGQKQKARQRGALTNCRGRREGQVRGARPNETVRGTHSLPGAEEGQVRASSESKTPRITHGLSSREEGTNQDRTRDCEGHSLPVECRGKVRKQKIVGDTARGTHRLSRSGWSTSQARKRKQDNERHSRTVERSGGTHQHSRQNEITRNTHFLLSAKGKLRQDNKRKRDRETEGHSQAVNRRGRDRLGHREKVRRRRGPTNCQAQRLMSQGTTGMGEKLTGYRAEREGQIRTIRECENASGTHFLSRPG